MADQADIEELLQYKKAVLFDERRDCCILSSIEATLEFFSRRRSRFINNFDSTTAIQNPAAGSARRDTTTYPQISRPVMASSSDNSSSETLWRGNDNQTTYPQLSRPTMTSNFNSSETLWMAKGKGEDIENGLQKEHDEKHDHDVDPSTVTLRERLKHFTFAWYACTMSTGGVAFVMSVVPNRFEVMTAIGTGMFIFNLFLFTIITGTIITRFVVHPGTLTHSLTSPHEGFFFATFWLSLATMITNTTAYGIPNSGPWLIVALRIAFWVYTLCATILAIVYYHVLFTVKKLVITNVLPGWVLPIFPAMLVGTLASAITKTQPTEHALPMLVAGLSFQGLGMMVAVMMYGLYFGSLLTSGLPIDMSRPAMFIAVGPPSFTALAFIGMAQDVVATRIFETYTVLPGIINQNLIPDALQLLALLSSIFLWTLAFWFFAIATIAAIEAIQRNDFHLNWYAYVFPNVGFTIATIKIGERLGSNAIQLVGTGMAGALFFLWLLIAFCHVKAIINRQICWPGKDEDAH